MLLDMTYYIVNWLLLAFRGFLGLGGFTFTEILDPFSDALILLSFLS